MAVGLRESSSAAVLWTVHYFHDRFWECFISRLPGIFASVQRRTGIRYDTASADVSLRRTALAANIL